MSKAIINALTLALLDFDEYKGDVPGAKDFAAKFVHDNADLFVSQVVIQPQQVTRQPGGPTTVTGDVVPNPQNPAGVRRVAVLNANGLTAAQQAAVDSGIGLCPNCQQPTNDHLPGCARASGEDPRARTKTALPPVQ